MVKLNHTLHNLVFLIVEKPRLININNPIDNPKVENQSIGTIIPATTDENNICTKAWPDAAVPLIFGKQSRAAIEIIGITEAIPILYNAIKPILIDALFGIKQQNIKLARDMVNIQ